MKRRKKVGLLLLVVLISFLSWGDRYAVADSLGRFNKEMIDVYQKQESYQLRSFTRGGYSYIEFCPDNTCDEFKMPITSSFEKTYDFIYSNFQLNLTRS